jgi:SAM-dependent methyltransferase
MALERIDPILLEDCYAVDHLLRYAMAAPMVKGKRVMDAACGMGFGSVLLMHQEASEVVGVDLSGEAIESCARRWPHDRLTFRSCDLEELASAQLGQFDLITSFETLEHVRHPGIVLEQFRTSLEAGGVLFGSVPGKTDRLEENEFHLHHFTRDSLHDLLRGQFKEVAIYRQDFSVKSSIREFNQSSSCESLKWVESRNLEIDFGRAGEAEDSLVFIASNGALPELDFLGSASSRSAWLGARHAYLAAQSELDSFSAKYRQVFLEHGDLKVKFANMLGWGKWHYEELHGQEPSDTVIERVEQATSQREIDLKAQVAQLQAENLRLKKALSDSESLLGPAELEKRKAFEVATRDINSEE